MAENKFKARLFDLFNHANLTVVNGYEIEEFCFDNPALIRIEGGVHMWYFKNQVVVVVNGSTRALEVNADGENPTEVSIEFFANRPALSALDIPDYLILVEEDES